MAQDYEIPASSNDKNTGLELSTLASTKVYSEVNTTATDNSATDLDPSTLRAPGIFTGTTSTERKESEVTSSKTSPKLVLMLLVVVGVVALVVTMIVACSALAVAITLTLTTATAEMITVNEECPPLLIITWRLC